MAKKILHVFYSLQNGCAAVKFQQATVGLLNMLDTGWEDKYVLHTED